MDEPGIHLFTGFMGLRLNDDLKDFIRKFRPGGLVLFRRNIEGRQQVKALVSELARFGLEELGRPLLFAIDQEGGTVQRLAPLFTELPSAKELAAEGTEAVLTWTRKAAADLISIGIQINFAPVLDIVPEGPHFMHPRSLGADPETVSELGRAWIKGLQENGISATAKHFPGLGRAALDPHHFVPVIENDSPEKFALDLVPFEQAIRAGVHCVMTSHAVYPSIDPERPATLSYEINQRRLRKALGFEGVLFCDDLDMEAIGNHFTQEQSVRWGLESSADFVLLCQKINNIGKFHSALTHLIESDEQVREAHRRSLSRIERLFRFHFG